MSKEIGTHRRWDMALRDWLEASLSDWGRFLARHPWPVIAVMSLAALALGSQIGKLEFETSPEAMLREDDSARVVYDDFRRQFGREEVIIISVQPPEVFDLGFLAKLRDFHNDLEERVPHLDEVSSLINARETRGEGDELIVRDLLEEWPETPAELASLEQRVLSNPLYRSLLISDDGRLVAVVVKSSAYSSLGDDANDMGGFDEDDAEAAGGSEEPAFITGEESTEVVRAVEALLDEYRGPDFEVHYAGAPVMSDGIMEEMKKNIGVFSGLSVVAVSVLLLLLFRRASAVLLSLVVVVLSILSIFGAMAIVGIPMGVPTQILPSFLLAVGVGAAVHLLVIFYQAFDSGASREDSIAFAMGHSGLAVIMTSLTTAAGLFSFVAAELAPVGNLGVVGPVGILLGLVYCLSVLPALLAVTPLARRPRPAHESQKGGWIQRFLLWTGDRCVRAPWTVVTCMSVIMLVAIAGITRLEFNYDPLRWFPETDPLRADMEFIDQEFGGTISLEVIIDTGSENGLHEPRILDALDRLRASSEDYVGEDGLFIGKAISLADVVKEIHQALNENRPEAYAVPGDRELIAQELLLFESSGTDDLENFVDSQFQKARMTLMLPYAPPLSFAGLIDDVMAAFRGELGDEVEITPTGFVTLITRALNALAVSMIRSYVLALVVIIPLMYLLLGTLRGGTAAMVPNLAPIILTLGLMGWAGIPLGLFTLMIGSIAIGLAVDNTIHFMHNFRRYYEGSGDAREAVRKTLTTTGHALLVAATSLSLAFLIYTFAELKVLFRFGLLTALTIMAAFIAGITVSPALMALAARRDRPARAEQALETARAPADASEVGSTAS